jgi:hypothetical protein
MQNRVQENQIGLKKFWVILGNPGFCLADFKLKTSNSV